MVTAAQARLDGPDRSGRIVLNLNDFTSHTFADAHPMAGADGAARADPLKCPDCCKVCTGRARLPPVSMKVRDMSQLMMVDQLLPFTARSSNTAEQTIFEQLFVPDNQTRRPAPPRCGCWRSVFPAACSSFLAPLMALLGVALTNRLTNWFALPLSCLVLMAVNLLCEWVITTMAPAQRGRRVAAAVAALWRHGRHAVFTLIVWRHNDFVRPQLARS